MEKVVILLNPSAGRGRSYKKKRQIEQTFESYGLDFKLLVTTSEDNLRKLAGELLEKNTTLVGVGGDTTFNILATEILKKKKPIQNSPNLGFLGTGSANDICLSLGIHNAGELCRAILNSRVKKMDVGVVNLSEPKDRVFFLGSMSIGLGTTVNNYIAEFSRRHKFLSANLSLLQKIAGGLGILNSFSKKKVPLSVTLKYNETEEQLRVSLLVFLNTKYYARGLNLGPETTAFDGQIDCISLETSSLYNTFRLQRAVKKGNHLKKKEFRMIRSNRFLLNFKNKTDIQLDGEIIKGLSACEVSILPQSLKVYVK